MSETKTIRLPVDLHRKLKRAAVDAGVTMQEIIRRQMARPGHLGREVSSLGKSLLARLKREFSLAFGKRFKGLILFGSEARGDATPDSDIDFLVLIENMDPAEDRKTVVNVTYPVMLELPTVRVIDATPVEFSAFEAQEFPLYRNARAEGVWA